MKKQEKIGLYALIAAVIIGIAYFGGFLSVAGGNDHHYTNVFGQNINATVTATWQQPTSGSCWLTMIDRSNNQSLGFTGTTFNDRTLCNFNAGGSISFDNFDFSKYQQVVIHRSGSLHVCYITQVGTGGSTSIPGASFPMTSSSQNNFGCKNDVSLGDVKIVNNGQVIIMYATPEAPAGVTITDPTKPLYFTTSINGQSDSGVTLNIAITGIDLTPFPAANTPVSYIAPSTPVAVTPGPTIYTNTTVPSTTPALSWWDRFIAWISALFSK